jgi:hypothetical protein
MKHSYKRNGKEITVEQKTVGNSHKYIVTGHDGIHDSPMDSVTKICRAVDGSSTTPISRWAVKQVIEFAKSHNYHSGQKHINMLDEAKKQPDILFRSAGNRGTRIHNAIESYLTGLEWENELTGEDDHDKLETCFRKVEKWINNSGLKIITTELPLYHKELLIGGAVDMILSDEIRRIYVVDFKTGSRVYKKDSLQVAAYISCLISMLEDGVELWDRFNTTMPHGESLDQLQIGGAIFHIKEDNASIDLKHINTPSSAIFTAARMLYGYWLTKDSEMFHKVTL